MTASTSASTVESTLTKAPRYAGFWTRFVAWGIDSTIVTIASWLVQFAILGLIYNLMAWYQTRHGQTPASFFETFNFYWLQVFNVGFYASVAFPYYVWGHFKYGTTLGKYPFAIYVVNAADSSPLTLAQSIQRCLGYALSWLLFACGYLMAGFHPRKQGLHDLIAGTMSVTR